MTAINRTLALAGILGLAWLTVAIFTAADRAEAMRACDPAIEVCILERHP